MPVFYQHTINETTQLGIWKIEEPENFFAAKVPVGRDISHPHKRLQHLAGRYLLQFLFPDFPYELIKIADTRKPFLSNEAYHFSISHCGEFAAAIVSRQHRVGVDIELVRPLIQKIKQKFLGEQEILLLAASTFPGEHFPSSGLLTLCWSAKEALFKWYGNGGVDFKNHMQLVDRLDTGSGGFIHSSYVFSKEDRVSLSVRSKMFGELVMSFVVS